MTPFTFSYKLGDSAWAYVSVSAGGERLSLTVSYLSDALGDLARAVISLFYEHGGFPVICSWQDEPGEYRWIMRRQGDMVSVEIREFDECFSRKDDEKGRLRFAAECPLLRLATQVKGQMHQLLNEFGEDGYKARWKNDDFPMSEFLRLTGLIKEQKRRLSDTPEQAL